MMDMMTGGPQPQAPAAPAASAALAPAAPAAAASSSPPARPLLAAIFDVLQLLQQRSQARAGAAAAGTGAGADAAQPAAAPAPLQLADPSRWREHQQALTAVLQRVLGAEGGGAADGVQRLGAQPTGQAEGGAGPLPGGFCLRVSVFVCVRALR
jgi:hypothetical protein